MNSTVTRLLRKPCIAVRIQQSISVVEGSLKLVLFEGRPFWHARIYDPRSRNSVTRSLKTTDQAAAQAKAIQLWSEIAPRIKADLPVKSQSIEAVVHQYYSAQQKRVDAGLIKPGALRDMKAQLKVFIAYCELSNVTELLAVKPHSFNGFVAWRRDESLLLTTGTAGVLKPASLNKAIREIRAWWKWLKSTHQVDFELELKEQSIRGEQVKTRNVVITESDWKKIEQELHRITFKQKPSRRTQPIHLYYRRAFYYLVQVLISTGLRPQEATHLLRWKHFELKRDNHRKKEDRFISACVLSVVNPSGKGSRKVVSNAGQLLQAFKIFASKWRKEQGFKAITKDDLIFCFPRTNEPYAYSQLGLTFRQVLKLLKLDGKGYTLRSLRATYVTYQISRGVSPYILSRNTGHSIEVMRKHYEDLGVQDLADALL